MIMIVMVGKKQRLTLIECNNDLGSMMDLAKVADLVCYRVTICACIMSLCVLLFMSLCNPLSYVCTQIFVDI